MRNKILLTVIIVFAAILLFSLMAMNNLRPRFPRGIHSLQAQFPRLYIFDCGILGNLDTKRFGLNKEEVPVNSLFVPCFLIVHQKGILIWDTGMVADSAWKPTGNPVTHRIELPGINREVTLKRPLKAQLVELGYTPADIKYLALSHYHYDHTANANDFASATWLVRREERDSMFSATPPGVTNPSSYSALRNSKTIILKNDEHDVFGDGTVIIKSAPGHTPGHQVLFVKLAKTGSILLSGDLYHFPEQRKLDRVTIFDFNANQTRSTRVALEAFLKKTGAQLWIQHDFAGNTGLRKSPGYYE
jgi:N-acyl homoserine lactone hydrolase